MKRAIGLGLLASVFVLGCQAQPGEDEESSETGDIQQAAISIPPGWSPLTIAAPNSGITLYQKSTAYVTVVNLKLATPRILTGDIYSPPNSPSYKQIYKKKFSDFWATAQSYNTTTTKARVVVSGTFFTGDNPTGIAFGLKKAGSLISLGYAAPGGSVSETYTSKAMVFTFNSSLKRAWIGAYNTNSFTVSPDVIGAMDVNAGYNATGAVGRTFLGVRDDDGDGNFETVFVYSATASTQATAKSALSSFGAQWQAMLDGSGSTFLLVDGTTKIATSDGRLVPQALSFYANQ